MATLAEQLDCITLQESNDKPFRFLDLPPELRNQIYDYVLDDYFGKGLVYIDSKRPSITQASSHLRKETLSLYFEHGHFAVQWGRCEEGWQSDYDHDSAGAIEWDSISWSYDAEEHAQAVGKLRQWSTLVGPEHLKKLHSVTIESNLRTLVWYGRRGRREWVVRVFTLRWCAKTGLVVDLPDLKWKADAKKSVDKCVQDARDTVSAVALQGGAAIVLALIMNPGAWNPELFRERNEG